jgi:hypothetical protein
VDQCEEDPSSASTHVYTIAVVVTALFSTCSVLWTLYDCPM